jgi:hypothetical protein
VVTAGVARRWLSMGKRWVVFFQDTNALAFVTLGAALGLSKALGLQVRCQESGQSVRVAEG